MTAATDLELYLIRHGETEYSRSERFAGQSDIALTHVGEAQAITVGQHLRGVAFDRVLMSPLLRAKETCRLARLDADAEVAADLRERSFGQFEGRLREDVRRELPLWEQWEDTAPDGETVEDVAVRADAVIGLLNGSGRIALFGHGSMLRVLAMRWLGMPLGLARQFALDTGGISVLGEESGVRLIRGWNIPPQRDLLHRRLQPSGAVFRREGSAMRLFSPVLLCALLAATASAQILGLEERLSRVLLEEAIGSRVLEDQVGENWLLSVASDLSEAAGMPAPSEVIVTADAQTAVLWLPNTSVIVRRGFLSSADTAGKAAAGLAHAIAHEQIRRSEVQQTGPHIYHTCIRWAGVGPMALADRELRVDELAVRILATAGYEPTALPALYTRLQVRSEDLARIQYYASAMKLAGPARVTPPGYEAIRKRLTGRSPRSTAAPSLLK